MIKMITILKDKIPLLFLMIIFLIVEVYCDLTLPSYTADIVNNGIQYSNFTIITSTGINMMIMVALSVFATIIVSYLSSIVSSSYARDLREALFEKILNFSNHELNKFSRSSLITRSTNDVNQIQSVLGIIFRTLLFAPILAIGSMIKVFEYGSDLSWIIFVAFILVIVLILLTIYNVVPYFKKTQEIVDRINKVSREILIGMPVIKAFIRKDFEEKRFDKENHDFLEVNLRVYRRMFLLMPAMNLVLNLMIVTILYFGSFEAVNGSLLTGDIIAFIQYSTQMVSSFIMRGGFLIMLPRVLVSARRIEEVFNTKISIKDGTDEISGESFEIEFKNVSFKYKGAKLDTLHDINFTLSGNKTTAIIGGTGSGKSTILNLIPRLQDVTDGEILLNGKNIKEISQKKLRNLIGYVPQQAILFSGSVKSNMLKGNAKATDLEIYDAINTAQANDFINDLDIVVEQNGSNFSGGQRQRLSIARAIVGKHEFYIFDDCFSALDVSTEQKLKEELFKKIKNKSMLIVSQRISSIKDADEIIVLNNGEIIDKGTHKELSKRCSYYKEIILSQSQTMEDL